MPGFTIASDALNAILAAAKKAEEKECCGLLLGTANRIEQALQAANVHPAPARHFEIDPAALIAALRAEREGGAQVIGYFHSHPTGPAIPSATDTAMAAGDGRLWAIVGGDGAIGWFQSTPGGFVNMQVLAV